MTTPQTGRAIDVLRERRFQFAGKSYTVRFTNNAFPRLQQHVEIAKLVKAMESLEGGAKPEDCIAFLVYLPALLCAGLEGARLKDRVRRRKAPWDIDVVGDLIEDINETNNGAVYDIDLDADMLLFQLVIEAFMVGLKSFLPTGPVEEPEETREATEAELEAAKQNDPFDPDGGEDGSEKDCEPV